MAFTARLVAGLSIFACAFDRSKIEIAKDAIHDVIAGLDAANWGRLLVAPKTRDARPMPNLWEHDRRGSRRRAPAGMQETGPQEHLHGKRGSSDRLRVPAVITKQQERRPGDPGAAGSLPIRSADATAGSIPTPQRSLRPARAASVVAKTRTSWLVDQWNATWGSPRAATSISAQSRRALVARPCPGGCH
jgi:hypothetical protein